MPPRDPRPDGGDPGAGFVVDVPSVQQAGLRLGDLGRGVREVRAAVDSSARNCAFAFAPSDVKSAFDYCAYRWSEHLEAAVDELTRAGDATVRAGEVYRGADRLPLPGRPAPR
jgi:hypothetical protein